MLSLTSSRSSIAFSISALLPIADVEGSWIIIRAVGAIKVSSPAIATTDAADAAMPSIFTVTLPL